MKESDVYTTTLILSKELEVDHDSILRLLKKYPDTFPLRGFEIGHVKTRGRPTRYFFMDELNTMILITMMNNSPRVVECKIRMAKAFFRQRKLLRDVLTRGRSAEELAAREKSKTNRLECMDTVKLFVNYALEQGSKSADKHYYANISKMENKALFMIEGQFKDFNIRDLLNPKQLNLIVAADMAVENALKEGMDANMHYKDIYKLAKSRVEALAQIFPPSIVPALEIERDQVKGLIHEKNI